MINRLKRKYEGRSQDVWAAIIAVAILVSICAGIGLMLKYM